LTRHRKLPKTKKQNIENSFVNLGISSKINGQRENEDEKITFVQETAEIINPKILTSSLKSQAEIASPPNQSIPKSPILLQKITEKEIQEKFSTPILKIAESNESQKKPISVIQTPPPKIFEEAKSEQELKISPKILRNKHFSHTATKQVKRKEPINEPKNHKKTIGKKLRKIENEPIVSTGYTWAANIAKILKLQNVCYNTKQEIMNSFIKYTESNNLTEMGRCLLYRSPELNKILNEDCISLEKLETVLAPYILRVNNFKPTQIGASQFANLPENSANWVWNEEIEKILENNGKKYLTKIDMIKDFQMFCENKHLITPDKKYYSFVQIPKLKEIFKKSVILISETAQILGPFIQNLNEIPENLPFENLSIDKSKNIWKMKVSDEEFLEKFDKILISDLSAIRCYSRKREIIENAF